MKSISVKSLADFSRLKSGERKSIIKDAIRSANKMQKKLMSSKDLKDISRK